MLLAKMLPGSGKEIVGLLAAIVLRTGMLEMYSFTVGRLYRSMIQRDLKKFFFFTAVNIFQDELSAVVEEAVIYLENLLGVKWYETLTKVPHPVVLLSCLGRSIHRAGKLGLSVLAGPLPQLSFAVWSNI